MKAIQLKKFGFENLILVEEKVPTPAAGEALVRVEAVSLNYIDLAMTKGTYNPSLALPIIPGSDVAGIVEAVGDNVSQWKKGDRVVGSFFRKWISGKRTPEKVQRNVGGSIPGTLAEYITISADSLVPIPNYLSAEEASTLPVAGVTAWAGLIELARIKPGSIVLTQGTGGVSIFALQLAKAVGAKVIATSGSDAKLEKMKSLGADEVINYKTHPQWNEEVMRLTNQQGVNALLDIGGAETIPKSVASLGMHGFIGLVGFLGGAVLPIDFFRAVNYMITIQGISVGSRETFEAFMKGLEVLKIKPVVDTVFPIEKTQEAFRFAESGSFIGKVVIKI